MKTAALIVAGGSGSRFGGDLPKQYAPLLGIPVIRRTLRRFIDTGRIDAIQVVIGEGHHEAYEQATRGLDLWPVVTGGATRQESTLAGLEALRSLSPRDVLVHDAARPLTSPSLIGRVIDRLQHADAVIPVLPVTDTLKTLAGGRVTGEIARETVGRSQTPQGFRYELLLAAHRTHIGGTFTDDAAVFAAGGMVAAAGMAAAGGMIIETVAGEEDNIKITRSEDLDRAQRVLAAGTPSWRTGIGIDVHAFADGRPLILAGVTIPHEQGLAGHSDADVALHAITDALLGAIAEGDIGDHFPPSDPQWRDADSALFLRHAVSLVAAKGGSIEHLDLVLLCEAPRIGPHREAMRQSIATIMGLGVDRVSVKATTTERLGFTGRREGIMAHCVATLRLEQPSS